MFRRPWLFYERIQLDEYEKNYTLMHDEHKKIPRPMKEIPSLKQLEEKLAPLKLEESSDTPIKKKI